MAYLQRYAAPRNHVRRILWRKLERSLAHHGGDREEVSGWIEEALTQASNGGLIDDARYVRDKVRGYVRRGASGHKIARNLAAKGITRDQVDVALADIRSEGLDPQLIAVASYIRRRRLGPFNGDERDANELCKKDLARLGRAGFSFDLASRVLLMESDEIEAIAFQRRFV